MKRLSDPPLIKVYEALSAVGSGRVKILGEGRAKVLSSSRDKIYDVYWSDDLREFNSNDNGTYWRGYVGYPIIAVLMSLNLIDSADVASKILADVAWKHLNDENHNDYQKVIDAVLAGMSHAQRHSVQEAVRRAQEQLYALKLWTLTDRSFKGAAAKNDGEMSGWT